MTTDGHAPAEALDRAAEETSGQKDPHAAVSNRRGVIAGAVVLALFVVAAVAYALVPGPRDPEASALDQTSGPAPTHPDSPPGTANPGATASGSTTVSGTSSPGEISADQPLPPPAGNNAAPGTPRPAAPSGITAIPISPTTVRLQWTDNAHDEIGFVVLRLGGGRVDLSANTTSYDWTGLPPLQHICFAVGAYNATGWSSDPFPPPLTNDWTCADTPDLPPAAPSGLIAEAVNGTTIVLHWTDNSSDETYFKILVADGQHQQIGGGYPIAYGGTSYAITIDRSVEVGVEYCFQIQAVNSSGGSAWTPWACTVSLPVPAMPSNLWATAVNESTIRLGWTDNSNIETVFKVHRKDRIPTTDVPANATSYDWTGLTPATEYCFRVNATNAAGYYAYTPFVCVTTPPAPAAG